MLTEAPDHPPAVPAAPAPDADDAQLLRAFIDTRDDLAFGRIVARHAAGVRRTALLETGNAEAAEDVTQATFIVLSRRPRPALRSAKRKSSAEPWLHQVARYAAANWRRAEHRRRKREKAVAMPDRTTAQDPSQSTDLAEAVAAALRTLRRRDRRLILLRHVEEKPWNEVAQRVNMTPEAARKATDRAMERLRQYLQLSGVAATSAVLFTTVTALSRPLVPAPAPSSLAFEIAKGTLAMLRLKSATFAVAAFVVAAGVTGTALITLAGEGDTANSLTARQKASSPQTQPKTSQPETLEDPDPFVIADAVYPAGQTLRIPLGESVFAEVVALTDGEVFWSPSGQLLERPAFDRVRWGGLGEVKAGQRRISVMARLVGDVPRGDLPDGLVGAEAPQVSMSGTGGHSSTDPHSIAGEQMSASYATIFDIPADQDVLELELKASAVPWRTIYSPWMDNPTGADIEGPEEGAVTVSGVAGYPAHPDHSQVILATTAQTRQFLPVVKDADGRWHAGSTVSAYKAGDLTMQWFSFPIPHDRVKERLVLGRGLHRITCRVAAKPEVRVEARPYVTPPTQHVEPVGADADN